MKAAGQRINLCGGVIKGEGGARGGRDAEALHDRLRAMVPGSNGDPLGVEDGADVVGVDRVEQKREYARFLASGSDGTKARDLCQPLGGQAEELFFIGEDFFGADLGDVV